MTERRVIMGASCHVGASPGNRLVTPATPVTDVRGVPLGEAGGSHVTSGTVCSHNHVYLVRSARHDRTGATSDGPIRIVSHRPAHPADFQTA